MADGTAQGPTPVPPPPPPTAPPVSRNVGMLILAYFGILALIPLIVEKNDREVQWHARHGLVLLLAEVVLWVGMMMVGFVLHFIWLFAPIIWLGIFVLHILMIVKAINGQRLLIPGLSEFADKF